MLIVALVLAVVGLAALVTAVVTSNELVAWVCIGASALGVLLLVADAIRERQTRRQDDETDDAADDDEDDAADVVESPGAPDDVAEYPDDAGVLAELEPEVDSSAGAAADIAPDQVTEVPGDGQER